jgi:hypothetical protein
MKNKTKIFFDTEFTGLEQKTSLISIGLITETGYQFYAELTDYNKNSIDEWLQINVVDNLWLKKLGTEIKEHNLTTVKGDIETVRKALQTWLSGMGEIEMWSDCLSYDWVLFNNIWGHAFKIPKCIYYIPFDICTLFKTKGIDPDISREKYAETEGNADNKHMALYDAIIIKLCYEKLISTNYVEL